MTSDKQDTVASASHVPSVDALVLHADDNVATALRALRAGETVHVGGSGSHRQVELRQDIALCHKFALLPMASGAVVTKYGESIGRASRDIALGELVHVHNLSSLRAR